MYVGISRMLLGRVVNVKCPVYWPMHNLVPMMMLSEVESVNEDLRGIQCDAIDGSWEAESCSSSFTREPRRSEFNSAVAVILFHFNGTETRRQLLLLLQ